ncbi:MAG: hypothetical protein ACT4QC_11005 [Planctomycetaceae bacterium]
MLPATRLGCVEREARRSAKSFMEVPMCRFRCWILIAALVLIVSASTTAFATGPGYVYVPRSFYVAPVVTAYAPVLYPAPIMVYEPAPAPPAPVVGTFYPLSPAPVRVRESWNNNPWRSRYRYEERVPGGPNYQYRYKRDGAYMRSYETWR